MNDETQFSERTTAFGSLIMRMVQVIERYPEPFAAWEAGTAHLFLWADRDPELLRSVDSLGNVAPLGNPPPTSNYASTEMMVADLMGHAEKRPEVIDDWRAGKVGLVLSGDAIRLIPAADIAGGLGPPLGG